MSEQPQLCKESHGLSEDELEVEEPGVNIETTL